MNKAALIIAASLLGSRVLGIFREMLLARTAGVSAEKNALDLAFLIPDVLNHVISTGFLSIIFIPIFTGYLTKQDESGAWKFFSNILNTLGIILLVLTIPSFIWMRELIQLFTSAATLDSALLDRATYFGRIILPAQLFIFAGSFLVAVQQTRKQFLIPSLTGLIYNAAIIIGGIIGRKNGLEGFAFGVPAGAFIGFFLLQIWGAKRGGVHYAPYLNPKHPDIYRYLKMMIPMSLGVGTMFGLEIIIRSFGGYFGSSGISSLNYAYRIMYTLVAVFGFSVGVAGYPDMARLVKEKNFSELNQKIWKSLSRMFVILVPAALAVGVLAFPVVRILFERGAFTRETSEFVAELLRWYLPASLGMCLQAVLIRSFYASEQMWTPTLLNTGIFALTIPLYLLAGERFGIYSVPFIGALGALTQVGFMIWIWSRKNGNEGMGLALKNMRIALAAGVILFLPAYCFEKFAGYCFREISLILLIVATGISGVLLFSFTLWIQKCFGSTDAIDLIRELKGKIWGKVKRLPLFR
ncbi:MAG: murein biosynthesis integral membrane protein MurJ [Fibrobacter sp.]|jgi:putative peptidoglycan lipid II flippase|nr:murein biosynthesis integral membrane protein MurJ [Fibrobacter sp.]